MRNAARIISDGKLPKMVAQRYSSFDTTALGKRIEEGKATLEECEVLLPLPPETKPRITRLD